MDRPKKVLVIGETGPDLASEIAKVTFVSWDALNSVTNVRDHDDLILYLPSLPSTTNLSGKERSCRGLIPPQPKYANTPRDARTLITARRSNHPHL